MDTPNNDKRNIIYLAALLHDIGKFYQRGDKSYSDILNSLSDFSKQIANDICPLSDTGRFGYQHVIWTTDFFESNTGKEIFGKIKELNQNLYRVSPAGAEFNVINLASNHHKPQSPEQAIISMADCWSAGIDRSDPETFEKEKVAEEKIKWGKSRYKKIPLYSVFNNINNLNLNSGFKLNAIDINKSIFPIKILSEENGNSENQYANLWKHFIDEFKKLPTDSIVAFTETLIFLLKKYTWCIPSNTMDMANVSLFDHLKTTAAFADCLYAYYVKNESDFTYNNETKRISLKDGKHPLILIGGDLSGIQNFIYNISSRKAALSLKGRSFYLQLLIDSIIQKIISNNAVRATIGHVLYASGGKFYMLLPNLPEVIEALKGIQNEIEIELWEKHQGQLSYNMDWIQFAFNSNEKKFSISESERKILMGELWSRLADKLSKKKSKKFQTLICNDNSFNNIFNIKEVDEKFKVCAVTGQELNENTWTKIDDHENDNDATWVSKEVRKHVDMGRALKTADYCITFKGEEENSKYLSNRLKHNSVIVNVANYLFDKIELTDNEADFRSISSADTSRVKTINNTNFLNGQIKGQQVSYGFMFYGGNKQAEINGEIKDFQQLTRFIPDYKNSETYLAVLRIDVDNLGEIFISGLPESQRSFAYYSNLSFMLDLFFSGYLNTLRNDKKYNEWVNILYSGGDDVFAIGRWDKIIEFAADIRIKFQEFVGREDITLSAGISIIDNKFPIAKAAFMAGEAELRSKQNNINGKKNALTFFGETISWVQEYEEVFTKKNKFVRLIIEQNMSKSILHKLMLYRQKKKEVEENISKDLSYLWNAAYYLKRFKERHKENKDALTFIDEIIKNDTFQNRKLDLLALAARWAEVEIKE